MRALAAGLVLALLMTSGCSDKGDDGDDAGGTDPSGSVSGGAGAGGSSSASGTGDPGAGGASAGEATITVAATGAYPVNPAFTPSTASVPAGAVVHVTFSNDDPVAVIQHNW